MPAKDVGAVALPDPPMRGMEAWVDESIRLTADGAYILAAVFCDTTTADKTRAHLRSVLLPKQSRIHWHDEGKQRRGLIADEVGAMDLTGLVVVGTPLVRAKQERARRLCMESLLPELRSNNVDQIWCESRTAALDRSDARLVSAMRSKKLLPSSMRVDHTRPSQEPMLWAADVVAGAVHAAHGSTSEWIDKMGGFIRIIQIALR